MPVEFWPIRKRAHQQTRGCVFYGCEGCLFLFIPLVITADVSSFDDSNDIEYLADDLDGIG